MTEEEIEAIEQLKSWREFIIKNKEKVNKVNDIEFYLRTALNLIQKQQEENEEIKQEHEKLKRRDLDKRIGITMLWDKIDKVLDNNATTRAYQLEIDNYFKELAKEWNKE